MNTEKLFSIDTATGVVPTLAQVEEQYIDFILRRNKYAVSAAARELGIDRRTVQRKVKRIREGSSAAQMELPGVR